ncbi:MAG: FAD binding domain-containing protein [Candidatus Binatia bacterium]
MKPPAFDYVAPRSLSEVCDALTQHGAHARILAGGQSLIPLLNLRLVRPHLLIDIGRIEGLRYIREQNGALCVGAGTSQRDVELHSAVEQLPALHEVLRHVGYPTTRNRGTVCGSLAYADPTAELPLALVALNGSVTARSSSSTREIRGRDLYLAPFTSVLRDDELLTEARFPLLPAGTRVEFAQFDFRRRAIKITAITAARLHSGQCEQLDLALAGVAGIPLLLSEKAREVLVGAPPTPERIAEAVQRCTSTLIPAGDRYGSARYRTRIAAQLVQRVLERALGLDGE